jgi:hypothetical protein
MFLAHANPEKQLMYSSCQSTATTGLQFMPVHIKCRSTLLSILRNYWYRGISRSTTTIRPQLMPIYVQHWSKTCANHSNYWSTVHTNLQQLLIHSSCQFSACQSSATNNTLAMPIRSNYRSTLLLIRSNFCYTAHANPQQLLVHSSCNSTATTGPHSGQSTATRVNPQKLWVYSSCQSTTTPAQQLVQIGSIYWANIGPTFMVI